MLIKSNFKDYYDCIQGLGQDKSIIFIRNKVEVRKVKDPKNQYLTSYHYFDNVFAGGLPGSALFSWGKADGTYEPLSIQCISVGFCGKHFNYLLVRPKSKDNWKNPTESVPFTTCTKLADIDKIMKEILTPKEYEFGYCYDINKHKNLDKVNFSHNFQRRVFKNYYEPEPRKPTTSKYKEKKPEKSIYQLIFEKFPIYVTHHQKDQCFFNGNLKEVDFCSVKDPYTAFHELQTYLANQAQPEKPIPQPDDKTMAEIKGFDEWSFRKEPSKKKKK